MVKMNNMDTIYSKTIFLKFLAKYSLLEYNIDGLNRPNQNNRDHLYDALNCGSYVKGMISTLLGDTSNKQIFNCLYKACTNNDINKVKKLLLHIEENDFGDDEFANIININDYSCNITSLTYACFFEYSDIVDLLLSNNNIDINKPACDKTPLTCACTKGHTDIVKKLLSCEKIDINKKDTIGKTSLINSCDDLYNYYPCTVELLLSHRDINVNITDNTGKTALIYACINKQVKLCKLLLKHCDIDVNIIDKNGKSVLMYSRELQEYNNFYGERIQSLLKYHENKESQRLI